MCRRRSKMIAKFLNEADPPLRFGDGGGRGFVHVWLGTLEERTHANHAVFCRFKN